jgi:hypothetical protein
LGKNFHHNGHKGTRNKTDFSQFYNGLFASSRGDDSNVLESASHAVSGFHVTAPQTVAAHWGVGIQGNISSG